MQWDWYQNDSSSSSSICHETELLSTTSGRFPLKGQFGGQRNRPSEKGLWVHKPFQNPPCILVNATQWNFPHSMDLSTFLSQSSLTPTQHMRSLNIASLFHHCAVVSLFSPQFLPLSYELSITSFRKTISERITSFTCIGNWYWYITRLKQVHTLL